VLLAFAGRRGTIYDAIRRDWVAALSGDRSKDLAGISAPVFGRNDELLGALTLTAPASRLAAARSRQLAPWLRRRAAELSRTLGASAGVVERMLAAR
jgi:DNA-binding IclR family transcriptional regulator